ncbi:TonB-linked SusC/RagA family outer membrane protein [Filimonas zeae]|nr:TonB-dependent receptor [Filimonas zeae]MDR6337820.1 TonB-linked SusC/RagA family outer membrane protein [Filimonas zeae]
MNRIMLALGAMLLSAAPVLTHAQDNPASSSRTNASKTVKGRITDDKGAPLEQAVVQAKGTGRKTLTRADGSFSLEVPDTSSVLMVSHVNMAYQEYRFTGTDLNLQMKPLNAALDDVIVVGYGTKKKSDVLGSVSTVTARDIEDLPVANLSTALKNRAPGVGVSQSSGRPGATTSITIRQATSFAGVVAQPLFVIDGLVEMNKDDPSGSVAFQNLDASQIETITFLKDAAATIYGSRGANGVVLVTTKRGKPGKPKINYTGSYGISEASKMPEMLNAYDHAVLLNQLVLGKRPFNVPATELYTQKELDYLSTLSDQSWLDQTWTNAHLSRHTVNISGGTDRITFFAGANYYKENGNLRDLFVTKYGLRFGMNAKITNNLTADVSISTDNTDLNRPAPKGTTATEQSDQMNATVSSLMYTPRWIPMYIDGRPVFSNPPNWHPFELQNSKSYARSKSQGLTINAALNYKVPQIEGLSFRVQYGRNTRNNFGKEYYPSYDLYEFVREGVHTNQGTIATTNVMFTNTLQRVVNIRNSNSISEAYDASSNWQLNEAVSYARVFGDHNISVMLAAEQNQTFGDAYKASREIQVIPGVDQLWAFSQDKNNMDNSGQSTYSGRVSYLGRLNYSLKNKYLLEAAFRRDASPNFHPDRQWGFFPSVALGWKISEESFFSRNVRFINDLKLRFNVGLTGNDAVGTFLWKNRYTSTTGMLFGTSPAMTNGLNPNVVPNIYITWEKALYKDIGLDGTFFNRKFNFSLDFYHRHNYDMLESPTATMPNSFGSNIGQVNYGQMNAWGIEGSLGYNGNITKDLSYFVNMNVSWTDNKVLRRYYNAGTDTGWKNPIGVRTDRGVEGYVATGIVRTQADVDAILSKTPGYTINGDTIRVGMLNYQDLNGDGKITELDRTRIAGRSEAILGGGFNLGMAYKGIKLSMNISVSVGGKAMWKKADVAPPTKDATALNIWKDSWTASNPNAAYPVIYSPWANEASTFWMRNGTMMRVNNMTLSYSLPAAISNRYKIPEFRVYVSGTNLWNIINPTPYKDQATNLIADYPILRSWTFGLSATL